MRRALAAAFASAALLGAASSARAAPPSKKAVLGATLVGAPGALHKPAERDGDLRAAASAIDEQLAEAAQDLGLSLDVGHGAARDLSRASEAELLDLARELGAVLVVPSIHAEDGGVAVRLVVVDPGGKVLHVGTARATRADASVQAAVLLRDLAGDAKPRREPSPAEARSAFVAGATNAPATTSTSGRAVLMVNATVLGGLVGFSIQKASGSSDPRLLYPLLAVGAGIGLGSSLLITEEWDVTPADAWYLSAGMWWPTLAGHFLYAGRFNTLPEEDRWEFGLIGATTGVTMSTLGVALRPMSEGGAWLAHSGGALGVVFGGLGEFMGRGSVHTTPFSGMGYGAGIGWLVTAAAATQWRPSPTRVLAVDIGAFVGGLAGAAVGSPLLFGTRDATKQRGWTAITGGAALAGGSLGFAFGRERGATPKTAWLVPAPDILGESVVGDRRAPIVGLAWSGSLEADGKPGNPVR